MRFFSCHPDPERKRRGRVSEILPLPLKGQNDKNVRHTHSRHCERSEAISIKKETLRLPRPSNEGLAMTC